MTCSLAINPGGDSEYLDVAVSGVVPTSLTGAGAITHVHTARDDAGNPLNGVDVWITTSVNPDVGIVAGTVQTGSDGTATFHLDAGTYYLWEQRAGFNFDNPTQITVS
jgi:hypothetical protein